MPKKTWSDEQCEALLKLHAAGASYRAIGKIIGKTERAVNRKLDSLGAVAMHRQKGKKERIGFLDIEASNLKSSFGICLSYCIADEEGKVVHANVIRPSELRSGSFDKRLMHECVRDLTEWTRLVTWNGARFDIPFLRTRCMVHGIRFPGYRELLHNDALLIARIKMRTLHSKRLQAVCEFLKIPAKDHPLNPDIWLKALSGDVKALDFILTHNKEDVVSLALVWDRMREHTRMPNTTI
jgi:uncharacterized protein